MNTVLRPRGMIATVLLTACIEPAAPAPPPASNPPVIDGAAVRANLFNALSAAVTVQVRAADSVVVAFGLAGAPLDSLAATVIPAGDSATVPVLGLLPHSRYALQVRAFGAAQVTEGDTLVFTTDTLPSDLPTYTASGAAPTPGFVVLAAGPYGLVIDNTGRVVWYRRFPNGPGLNFEAEPTGHYFARPTTPDPTDRDPWVEIDVLGTVVHVFGCAAGLEPRFHDLIALPDGTYWVMCDAVRTMDLSAVGGSAAAEVTGTVVQHVTAAGALLFQWSPFDHFAITDLDLADRTGASVNWTHGNALDFDGDGALLVSFRSLNEITKIDTTSGAVIWRMGGLRNQFTFSGAPGTGFLHQHGLRRTGPGSLVLLDNLGDPTGSRAERYAFDAAAHTAQLVASYGSLPAVTAMVGGTTQGLPGDHTLVSFGPAGRVQEYDAAGNVVWQIAGNAGYVFRAQRIRSLYHPGVGWPR